MDDLPTLKADELVDSYINGNRNSICQEILAGPKPALMAALVAVKLNYYSEEGLPFEFIRILAAQM